MLPGFLPPSSQEGGGFARNAGSLRAASLRVDHWRSDGFDRRRRASRTDECFVDDAQVFAFICGLIVILLMILCLASSNWLIAHKFRQGLWEQCVEEDAPLPLPFGLNVKPGCYVARTVAYIQAAAALCVITLLCDIAATVMTGCGLCSKNPVRKYLMYRLAFYVMIEEEQPAAVGVRLGVYGVGWGAAIFLFGAILLLLCDKETEEIYYRERALPHDGAADSKA
ncbi:hypothetical protein HPB52_008443 [Rhipicephalus sanguineus]|uniref:Uncharacterized protein n=1 Tax=Rhipicephalus sanguineus TaxID=34632 RepID=A0A9D4PVD6_RHISA|nr:hypothetical protein HPB52_008443 [Rhipicephalus sanguineus]